MTIQRALPLADQVTAELRARIRDRRYPPGSRLPSESELAKELGVSRTTIRTVLSRFASEGLILRKQGDGTYINERLDEVDTHYGGLWDFSRLIEASGYAPSIRTISLEQRLASAEERERLALDADTSVVVLERLFSADGRPAIYTINVIPGALLQVDPSALNGQRPIHDILQTCCNERIAYVTSTIEAATVDKSIAKRFGGQNINPILLLNETFYNDRHSPIFLGTSFYNFRVVKLNLVRAWG